MKKVWIGLMSMTMLLVASPPVFAAAGGNITNSGNDHGYNPPTSAVASCDSGHGAFGAFSHHNGTWIPTDAKEDNGLGHATGPANANYSQACRTS